MFLQRKKLEFMRAVAFHKHLKIDLIERRSDMNDDPKISIYCLVYNHEKYLKKCLKGFVNQKTDFKYEIIVHDDCSTDRLQEIILEYAEQYPDLIIPILQKENQYSKRVSILKEFIFTHLHADYVAVCEGDDYWGDENKLQKLYDYMQKNCKCSLCVHNTLAHDLSGNASDKTINDWSVIHVLSDYEVFFGWYVHTSSYFVRRECLDEPEWARKYWRGDYRKLVLARSVGDVVCLPDVISVYNYGNGNGATVNNSNLNSKKLIEKVNARAIFLKHYDEFTEGRFKKIISLRLKVIDSFAKSIELKEMVANNVDKRVIIEKVRELSKHIIYFYYIQEQKSIIRKFKVMIKFKGYIVFPLWIMLYRNKL